MFAHMHVNYYIILQHDALLDACARDANLSPVPFEGSQLSKQFWLHNNLIKMTLVHNDYK